MMKEPTGTADLNSGEDMDSGPIVRELVCDQPMPSAGV